MARNRREVVRRDIYLASSSELNTVHHADTLYDYLLNGLHGLLQTILDLIGRLMGDGPDSF